MFLLKKLADNTQEGSFANRMRRKRFAFFKQLLCSIPRPMRILDVGGTQDFWLKMGFGDESGVTIVITNVDDVQRGVLAHEGAIDLKRYGPTVAT